MWNPRWSCGVSHTCLDHPATIGSAPHRSTSISNNRRPIALCKSSCPPLPAPVKPKPVNKRREGDEGGMKGEGSRVKSMKKLMQRSIAPDCLPGGQMTSMSSIDLGGRQPQLAVFDQECELPAVEQEGTEVTVVINFSCNRGRELWPRGSIG